MPEDLKALVKQMAEAKGLGQYWPIIEQLVQLESSWDPTAPSSFNAQGTEDSWGLFQLNRMSQGLGTGYSVTALKNPRANAEIALNKIASVIQGGGTIQDALGDWVNARNQIFGGQGGAVMAGTQTASPTEQTEGPTAQEKRIEAMFAAADKLLAEDDPYGAAEMYASATNLAKLYGIGVSDTGTATTTTTIPSAQETAIGQWDMETWLADAIQDQKEYGDTVAADNFARKITQAQEGRLQATAAQEYARNLAPPGMTELKLGPLTGGIPLGPAVPSTYSGMMELMGQNIPQAPELQYQPGALPQMPNLAALPSQQQSTQVTVPYAGEGATLAAPAGSERSASFMQAIRNYIARFGQTFPGGQLPVGR